jgi:hypothetical protein
MCYFQNFNTSCLCIGSETSVIFRCIYPLKCISVKMAVWVAETCGRCTVCIMYFHTPMCICWFFISFPIAQCTFMGPLKFVFTYLCQKVCVIWHKSIRCLLIIILICILLHTVSSLILSHFLLEVHLSKCACLTPQNYANDIVFLHA